MASVLRYIYCLFCYFFSLWIQTRGKTCTIILVKVVLVIYLTKKIFMFVNQTPKALLRNIPNTVSSLVNMHLLFEDYGYWAIHVCVNYERFAIRNCAQWVALGMLITRIRKPLKTLNKVQFVCVFIVCFVVFDDMTSVLR